MKKIAIIIPAYNEDAVILEVLKSIPKQMKIYKKNYNLTAIVVDDGSTDKTASLASSVPGVILIKHLLNSGAGAATRTGLLLAKNDTDYEFAATMDADGQHRSDDIRLALNTVALKENNIVIGSRLIDSDGMPWYKVLGNKGLNFFTFLLLGVSTTDSQSGLKALDRIAIEKLEYQENGFAFCSEMLWRAKKAQLKISEVPIKAVYTDYSKGKGQSNWNAFQILKQLIKHRITDFINE